MQKRNQIIILLIIAILMLASCSHNAPAPVQDITNSDSANVAQSRLESSSASLVNNHYNTVSNQQKHVVMPGDTLFSIAWRYSLDYKDIAKLNQLKAYRIYPGQQLTLKSSSQDTIFVPESLLAAINVEIIHKNGRVTSSKRNNPKAKTSAVHSSNMRSSHKTKADKSNRHMVNITRPSKIKRWIWPVNGKVINRFSTKLNQNKGVDIVAKLGSPVRATAEGRVVYSGKGLRGYGRLVIIKHNDNYLSAYAHNNKIYVEENEFVKAGQRIADLGRSGSDREKLHFEIRFKGKPVDPLNYLPKSGLL